MTYIKENTNINKHRRVIVKVNNKNILKSAYRDNMEDASSNQMLLDRVDDNSDEELNYYAADIC